MGIAEGTTVAAIAEPCVLVKSIADDLDCYHNCIDFSLQNNWPLLRHQLDVGKLAAALLQANVD